MAVARVIEAERDEGVGRGLDARLVAEVEDGRAARRAERDPRRPAERRQARVRRAVRVRVRECEGEKKEGCSEMGRHSFVMELTLREKTRRCVSGRACPALGGLKLICISPEVLPWEATGPTRIAQI